MLPRLYDVNITEGGQPNKTFLGTLTACKRCNVRENTDGIFTLGLDTTVNDDCAGAILSQRFIGIKPNPFDDMQLFEIQKTSRSLKGIITAEAKHIKNLCFQICSEGDFTFDGQDPKTYTGTPAQTWNKLISDYITDVVPFSFSSDITTAAAFRLGLSEAETLGNILGGKEGSFLDTWHGDYHWDNFNINFLRSRGKKSSYAIRYGQNISSAIQTEACDGLYSQILPHGKVSYGNRKITFFAPPVLISGSQSRLRKTFLLDCTSMLDAYSIPDNGSSHEQEYALIRQAMTAYAQKYANDNNLGIPQVGIKVDVPAALDEMKQLGLYDTVNVILDNFGTTATAQITDVTYDALNERWKSLTVGSPTVTVADLILNPRRFNL